MKTLHILSVSTFLFVGTFSKEMPQTESIKHKHLAAPFISGFLRTQLSYNTCRQRQTDGFIKPDNDASGIIKGCEMLKSTGQVEPKYLLCQAK